MTDLNLPAGMTINAPIKPEYAEILTPEALAFVAELHRRFEPRRRELMQKREERQQRLDAGELPDFLPETAEIRAGDWKISPLPDALKDRRVEITGPVDRKMIINALNSGAKMFMADFEDASSPTWDNCVQGQINLRDAVRGTISLEQNGKSYKLNDTTATLLVRPRGWHLPEKHVQVDGETLYGAFFDFGLFFFHNAKEQLARGKGPYFYLPKMESHLEARLWNDVFNYAEDTIQIPRGSIRATVLIETIVAAFEMDEILYELREHSAGLNCGRWDYIFSYIKKLRNHSDRVLPDRAKVTMAVPMMQNYSKLAIQTCHKRGAPAIGGMSAFIPVKGDEEKNAAAFEQVRVDKEREATNGHDGTWVAHPGMVQLATEVFDRIMPQPNQIGSDKQKDFSLTATDLLQAPEGSVTEAGVRTNINVGIQYLAAWLRGSGAVPIHNLMEDAATAEISRAQLWQWLKQGVTLEDGRTLDQGLFDQLYTEETDKLGAEFADASALFKQTATGDTLVDFLTLPGYQQLA
ncbi:malate synthase A [Deinococcus radiodurans]|jgi:malate synthase A|uniref:Malate synthase n=1 Tax=Deinococcus radiodurans (strain ATCC 13939 / DSM 20539 / JCM 16871 / CCUG 27074 / LMG 4051 / NBRC 15346 / NCIMB 9279 / VKM B-1422 / R1) TaxID=243230 RepID=Q9RYN3_DEIRA|nr:malate synthase A [Deinococcus radiodurans]AAF12480.1 malate synthase [Deinococcus radiodurans R1 = ATCC 13939 = DSM 20539]ANC73116.1 malate synthase A [Deinococcus radiodurans R1 = ATCC 13939 = DSM 20539]QEM73075.1 malate synthase A [Deinococcus radiodurans]QIP30256.1 malate synthase A [Deinococcus radiodurans]QIP33387.1 malate synthase A [Deinococcus radiodurans]